MRVRAFEPGEGRGWHPGDVVHGELLYTAAGYYYLCDEEKDVIYLIQRVCM